MFGGGGNDIFVCGKGSGHDTIADFPMCIQPQQLSTTSWFSRVII